MYGVQFGLFALLGSVFAEAQYTADDQRVSLKKACLGVDYGTTYTAAVVFDKETHETFPIMFSRDGKTVLPSTLYISKVDENNNLVFEIGYQANSMNQFKPSSDLYFYGHKRLIGVANLNDPVHERLSELPKHLTYQVAHRKNKSGSYYAFPVKMDGKVVAELTPRDCARLILSHVREKLKSLGYEASSVVVTTPAYFTPTQDDEIRGAAVDAGFMNVTTSKEPIAACVTYAQEAKMPLDVEEKVLVFDLGGGTFDLSVVEIVKEEGDDEDAEPISNLQTTAMAGNNFLGGENLNDLLVAHFLKKINPVKKLSTLEVDMMRLRIFTEEFKIAICEKQLAEGNSAVHTDTFVLSDNTEFTFTMKATEFDEIAKPFYNIINDLFFNRDTGMFRKTQGNANVKIIDPDQIHRVILVGGSTRVPYIREYLKKICPKAKIHSEIDADMAVARGACLICTTKDPEAANASIMVRGSVPLPIGIEVAGGLFQPIIAKDVAIPTFSVMPFTTVHDNQRIIHLRVAIGVRPKFDDNQLAGDFHLILDGSAPAGVPKIEVRIDYYADYTFKVTAKDTGTQKMVSKTFSSAFGRPSEEYVKTVLAAAKEHEEEDNEVKEKATLLQTFDVTLKMFEEQVKTSNLSEDDRVYFESVIQGYKEWNEQSRSESTSHNVKAKLEELKKETEELMVRAAKAGEQVPAEEAAPEEPTKETREEL